MNTINVFFYKGIMSNVAVKVFCFKHILYSKSIPLNATAFLVDPLPACLPGQVGQALDPPYQISIICCNRCSTSNYLNRNVQVQSTCPEDWQVDMIEPANRVFGFNTLFRAI